MEELQVVTMDMEDWDGLVLEVEGMEGLVGLLRKLSVRRLIYRVGGFQLM